MDGLTAGRIVHYVGKSGQHYAAIVTAVKDEAGTIDLTVFPPAQCPAVDLLGGAGCWRKAIEHSETPAANTWHWIERA